MKSNGSDKTEHKSFYAEFKTECIIALGICLLMICLSIAAAFLATKVHAAACMSIDVPPQAVIGQPDGDTFHIFAFQPGGIVKIRVQGVNTPERNQAGWAEAKAFTKDWLSKGVFRVNTCGRPTLDRIVAIVERNGETLGDALRKAGLGK